MKVGYFGRPGSYSHQAATQRFGPSASYISCPTHSQVVDALLKRQVAVGVLPMENSVAGVVMDTIDSLVAPEFVQSNLKIREYIQLSPHLALLSNYPFSQIRRLYSHPYPLRYLAQWIRKHLPKAELFETVSTSEAAQLASEQPAAAAIAGPHAAKIYRLKVLSRGLANKNEYLTRFCIVTSKRLFQKKPTHCALCFGLRHRPGALVEALSVFARHNLNLTRILSRPLASRTRKFEPDAYLFWVDIDLSSDSAQFKRAMKELKSLTTFLDVIGEYSINNRKS